MERYWNRYKWWWFDFGFLHCFGTMSKWSTGFYQLQINTYQRYHGSGKKPHQNIYLILNCQLLAFSLFSQPYLFDNFCLKSPTTSLWTKKVFHRSFFFHIAIFNLILRNIELLTHFTEVSVSSALISVCGPLGQLIKLVCWGSFKLGLELLRQLDL